MASASAQDAFQDALLALSLPLLSSLQIGALITWGLQGVLCVQAYNYYLSFPKDPLHMKALVFLCIILEILHTVMVTRDTYTVFAKGFGDIAGLDNLHFLWFTLPILGGVVGFLCHITFAYRITLLSESKITGGIITSIAVCACVSAFVFGGKLVKAGILSKLVTTDHIYLTCGIWNGSGAVCDIAIAGYMTFYLSRNSTGFRNTDLLITRIIRLTIETGVATATASIVSAVLFVGFRQKITTSVYFIVPAIMITKLYAVTILATFNNRPHAVGGPPPLTDIETCFDDSVKNYSTTSNRIDNVEIPGKSKIRIGRIVEQQVWKDDMPMSNLSMYEDDSGQSIKDDDTESTRKIQEILTPQETDTPGPKKF